MAKANSNTITLSFNEADLLLEALTIWACGEDGAQPGDEVEFAEDGQVFLTNDQISDLFTRIGNAKFSTPNTGA